MNRKKLIIGIALVALLALAGCGEGTNNSGEDLAEDAGANISESNVGESYQFEVRLTEKNQYGLVQAQPPFTMEESLERQNLIRRYQYLNNRNNVHHVYFVTEMGQVLAYHTAQGKVSSVNSKLTNGQQIVPSRECTKRSDYEGQEANCYKAVESPQMDGSYGTNGDAIFFFTTEGHYVEYNGKYVVSEEPLNIQSEVILTEQVGDDSESGGSNSTNSTE